EGENYIIKPEIRKMVIFAQHDITKNPPYSNMRLISCRNMLIYMEPSLQKKVFNVLLFGLKIGGYLYLGSSETPSAIIHNLEVIDKKWRIFKNISTKRHANLDLFSLPEVDTKPSKYLFQEDEAYKNTNHLSEIVCTTLVNEMQYLLVCIDDNNHVIKTYGDTTKFLLQKNFTTDINSLLPRAIAVAFNTLRIKALKTGIKCTINNISSKYDGHSMKVNLSVSPIQSKNYKKNMFLLAFAENFSDKVDKKEVVIMDEKLYFDQYTLNLEEELKDTREKLNFSYEKLDAQSENMQSFNEELLSSNEEMQSTNEEMQSVNEELHTINADYQLKNKELIETNDDLNNYFRSNINGQLFVNNDLILMKFSPGTVKQINLLPTDIGRPSSNISTNIKFETIENDIKKVIAEGLVQTKEIETNNGKFYQVMTMPYLSAENKINGAMLTFNDVTELKKAQAELDEKNKSLLRINSDHDNFIYTVSHDLLGPLSNIESLINLISEIDTKEPLIEKYTALIKKSVGKFQTLVADMANIAKLESEIVTENINLDEMLEEIEWSLTEKIKTAKATITKKLEVENIHFSKKNLRSIIYNLISNSIKFRAENDPEITIATTKKGENTIISVEDNGIGMTQDKVKKIFSKYSRLQQVVEGQGIGLYLAKKIIDAAGGDILVESVVGKGSKFSVYLNANIAQI
ncbi:MAG: ATP-binding protein, partial [Cytophagales bacterium]